MKRKALGKGLDALLPAQPLDAGLIQIDVSQIHPNRFQPRMQFEPERLQELADSITENGIIQPIIVRRAEEGYELVAGERRWRAAQTAGLTKVPAVIQDLSDQKLLELALVENIQRDELNAIEEAHAYHLLIEEFGLSQQEISQRVGRSRAAVTNILRLLKLPQRIQALVVQNQLSMGHARALIPLPLKHQLTLVQQIIDKGLSVREVELRAGRLQKAPRPRKPADPNLRRAEERLEERWKTRIQIRQRNSRGQIILHFFSPEERDRLYDALLRLNSS